MIKNFTKAVLGLLVAGAVPAFAQQYQVSIDVAGDEYANKVLIDGSNVTLVGATNATPSAGAYDMMIMNGGLDGTFTGSVIQAGGAGNETARAVSKFVSGNATIAGASNSFSTTPANIDDLFLITLTSGGGPAWVKVLGTDSLDRCFSVTEGNDNNVIIAGQTKQGDVAKFNGIVAKLDAATGAVMWSKSVGTSYTNEVTYHVQKIQGVGYMVVGYSGVNVMGLNDCMAVLLNEDGTKNSAFIFGGPGDDDARVFVDGGSGSFFIAGNTRNIGQGGGDAFLARFSTVSFPTITMDWFKTYGGTQDESLASACANSSNSGVVLCGSTQSFGTGGEAFAISVDNNGVIQWSRVYGSTGSDIFQGIAQDGSGGFVGGGYSNSFGGTANNAWVVRMDANGNSLCNNSGALFVEATIANTSAYSSQTDPSLADILSTDIVLTQRDVSSILSSGVNQNPLTSNTLCTTVSVDENSAANVVGIYPNPAGETLNFNFGVNAADAKGMVIYNALGAKVYETTLSNVTSVFSADISNLANGMYTAVVFMNNTQVTAKFTVAK